VAEGEEEEDQEVTSMGKIQKLDNDGKNKYWI